MGVLRENLLAKSTMFPTCTNLDDPAKNQTQLTVVSISVKRGEYGAVPECKDGGGAVLHQESNPARLGGRRVVKPPRPYLQFTLFKKIGIWMCRARISRFHLLTVVSSSSKHPPYLACSVALPILPLHSPPCTS
ncbi:hypothetical protein PR048_033534 [Dryococelus australis]|uniref:Uncharacterized protein n=1 Tax=Dryococelus australis TaxID=614101 RepID=A0ABQ9G0K1_9NEOP|nr:hypothetical protein PR048_033534 [Dryococelus australis]